jgi:hypothetical protein
MEALTACKRTVSGSFHPPSGVLFTFPSRYLFTIGRHEYFALEGGPPSFPRNFTCSAVLRCRATRHSSVSTTGLSPALADLPRSFVYSELLCDTTDMVSTRSYNPPSTTLSDFHGSGLGSSPFAHHYLGNLG